MCEHEQHHGAPDFGWGHTCGCCGEGGQGFHRRFATREEKIARLEAYLKELQAEAKAVEEHLARLKAKQ